MVDWLYSSFEKYRTKYDTILAIAVILDSCSAVDFCYTKLYGPRSVESSRVRES